MQGLIKALEFFWLTVKPIVYGQLKPKSIIINDLDSY